MIKAGITGGIGSGKTTICRVFETLFVPVFYADEAARWLMEHDAALVQQIKSLFGPEAYLEGRLNRQAIAAAAFRDPEVLGRLNALTHPATIRYGKAWMQRQKSPYIIKEAALFFESGSYKEMDVMIGVSAPEELRIRRAMKRDNRSRAQVLERLQQQMDQESKMQRCDYVIINDDAQAVIPQVLQLHEILLQRSRQHM